MTAQDQKLLALQVVDDPVLIAAYFKNVESFQADRVRSAKRLGRLGLGVGAAGALVGLAGVAAAAFMSPLKTVVPLVFRVDSGTGIIERVYDLDGGPMAASDAVKRYFAWNYTRLREEYHPAEARSQFAQIVEMSATDVQLGYQQEIAPSNPYSAAATLGQNGERNLRWVSTSLLSPNLAQVRFDEMPSKEGAPQPVTHMVATIGFSFSAGRVSASDINVNPLGFVVTSYHIDQEAN